MLVKGFVEEVIWGTHSFYRESIDWQNQVSINISIFVIKQKESTQERKIHRNQIFLCRKQHTGLYGCTFFMWNMTISYSMFQNISLSCLNLLT